MDPLTVAACCLACFAVGVSVAVLARKPQHFTIKVEPPESYITAYIGAMPEAEPWTPTDEDVERLCEEEDGEGWKRGKPPD